MDSLPAFEKIAPYLTHPLVLGAFSAFLLFGLYRLLLKSGVIRPLSPDVGGTVVHRLLDHGFLLTMLVVLLGFGLQVEHGIWLAPLGIAFAVYVISRETPLFLPRVEYAETKAQRTRQMMLKNVRDKWVAGVLEKSLYQVARMELGLNEAPEAIDCPGTLVAQQPDRAPRALPDDIPMVEVYDQFDQTLLILGAPGSGKTTLLLELTRDLIERAKGDQTQPIPVVFNLSSWAVRRPVLTEWLVDELNQSYYVPRKMAEAWVEREQVLPLLDGIDEVASEHREACVEAINGYRAEHWPLPLVVTSRSAEYEGLSKRLRMPGAVSIQPLTHEQVEAYLAQAGTALSGVRAAVRQDEMLWALLDTPLMLSILALAYRGSSEIRIKKLKGTLEERRAALFDAYIEAMFTPPPGRARAVTLLYTPQQIRHWLSWLARAMVRHDQTVFYLERMQPEWLHETSARLQRTGAALGVGLIVGLVVGLFLGLLVGPFVGLVGGLFYGLLSWFMAWLAEAVGLFDESIKPAELLRWSLGKARAVFVVNIVVLPVGSLGVGLIVGLMLGLAEGVSTGLSVLLGSGLLVGLTQSELSIRTIPNEGIRRSLKNAVGVGLSVGLVLELVGAALGVGSLLGLSVGLVLGLAQGGRVCIQHGVLRILLWRYDYAPLRYVRFLEHAKDLLFLRRVGGGYIFVHRMLMEHFAGMEAETEDAAAGERV